MVVVLLTALAHAQEAAPAVLSGGEATLLVTNLVAITGGIAAYLRENRKVKEAQAATAPTTPSALTEAMEKVATLTKERDEATEKVHDLEEKEKKRKAELRIGAEALKDMEGRLAQVLKAGMAPADVNRLVVSMDRLAASFDQRKTG